MAKATTDHETIRHWVEERGGSPAHVERTGARGDADVIRIDFPEHSGRAKLTKLSQMSWDEWFDEFERQGLALVYQDRTRRGQPSRFSKLVRRDRLGAAGSLRRERTEGPQPGQGAEGMDAIEMLESQHRMVEELFARLAQPLPALERRRAFAELADTLVIHSTIEERHFYPAVKTSDTRALVERSVREHLEVARVLATLLASPPAEQDLPGELEELVRLTEEHVIEEEQELFPKVRKLLDREDLVALAQQMASTMVQLQREGEPRGHVDGETEAPTRA
jgi:hypothetical protein